MPETIKIYGRATQVATEEELLDFANKVRKAGGADVLNALLPSIKSEPKACLIARALNFDCIVAPWSPVDDRSNDAWPDGTGKWVMIPQRGNPDECEQLTRELAELLKLRLVRTANEDDSDLDYKEHVSPEVVYALMLPKHIGMAASAFDAGAAFEQYATHI